VKDGCLGAMKRKGPKGTLCSLVCLLEVKAGSGKATMAHERKEERAAVQSSPFPSAYISTTEQCSVSDLF
jgi:hypothetical protein